MPAANVHLPRFARSSRNWWAAENPKKPLSDSKIADVLADQGIRIARRTIAKYREALSIAPSNERKQLV